jgi:ribosome-binding factor A
MSRIAPKSGAPSHRLERVAEQIRHAVSEILARGEIEDPVFHRTVVTIAGVRMSPDLKLATVSFLPLGGHESTQALAALQTHRKALRTLVARRVNLKYAPELRFVLDESFDVQARMDALLRSPQVARDLAPDPESDEENQ